MLTKNIIFSDGLLNYNCDAQVLFQRLNAQLNRRSRFVLIAYNPYIAKLYKIQKFLGLRNAELPDTFFTHDDLENIGELCDLDLCFHRNVGHFPWRFLGLGTVLNAMLSLIPFLNRFSLAEIIAFRPRKKTSPSVSVVIPARNEKGNIESAITRMPNFGVPTEILFIEGHSKDGTYEEIKRIVEKYHRLELPIRSFQQSGEGKVDAVRLGFEKANYELLMILDADLTMPPEYLKRFYDAFAEGKADFINGSRLVYPMEGEAMHKLNKIGNKFFAKFLSFILRSRLTDSLCGTKVVLKDDYEKFIQWRSDFGDFDPFGDFELLFPATQMALGVIDIPIPYKNRVYGSTQIRRFKHGAMLFKMVAIGFFRIRLPRFISFDVKDVR
jgi:hypothetical protein